jgi:hypothetical protein
MYSLNVHTCHFSYTLSCGMSSSISSELTQGPAPGSLFSFMCVLIHACAVIVWVAPPQLPLLCSTALSRVYEAALSRLLKDIEGHSDAPYCKERSTARLEALPVAPPPDMQSLGAAWEGVAYCSEAIVRALQIQLESCAAAGALRSTDVREKVCMSGMCIRCPA